MSSLPILRDYVARLFEMEARPEAREESFYPLLAELLGRYAAASGRREVRVTTIPRKTEECLLDFQVWGGRQRLAGYVEAKRPGTDLAAVEESPQLRRYRKAFPNLLLTDFYEIRLYRRGEPAGRAAIVRRYRRRQLTLAPEVEDPAAFCALLDSFLGFTTPRCQGASTLAAALAGRASVLASRLAEILGRELKIPAEERSELEGLYLALGEYLIPGLAPREFADLYAQTIAYGLLVARYQAEDGAFDRRSVVDLIPKGSGVLRDLFRFLSLGAPPPEIAWIVDDLVELLEPAPVRRILDRFYRQNRGHDPIVHFYETFLARYDGALRKHRGVYYTPRQVVTYLVRSLDRLVETRLEKPLGLANPQVTLLDPAAGTLTFLVEAFHCAIETYRRAYGGGVEAFIHDHLLRDFFAFELMMAPYAIGHLKVLLALREAGYALGEERCPLYLTNTLANEDPPQSKLPLMASLSREARAAARIKSRQPLTVILGNPPYSGHSANRDKAIRDRFREPYVAADGHRDGGYYEVDGRPLDERNPKWLQDDYVKFLRWAQRKVDEQGEGIVGFVTNHGYLDNPTFRGLRQSLLRTFDQLYLFDLHGNRKKKETAADGGPDENVFEAIEQGVAIALLVKRPGLPRKVCRADLRGSAREKLDWLEKHDVLDTPWREIEPRPPSYLFLDGDAALEAEYRQGTPLTEIFASRTVGIVTARDELAIDFTREELAAKLQVLRGPLDDDLAEKAFLKKGRGCWDLVSARGKLRGETDWQGKIAPILYRPFDRRFVYYADYLVERTRGAAMRQMLGEDNLGLIVPRQSKEGFGALATDLLVGHKAVSAYDINSVFPLYLKPEGLFAKGADREANLEPSFRRSFAAAYGAEPDAGELLAYVYAILYSPPYRARFADLLRRDFPRIPFPRERRLLLSLARLGRELLDLHRLRSPRLVPPLVRSHGEGRFTLAVAKRRLRDYRPEERRVYVSDDGKSFSGLAPEVWAYRIGGYQVLDRWLASRAGRTLSCAEIEDFCQAATAIHHTLPIERSLTLLYAEVAEESLKTAAAS